MFLGLEQSLQHLKLSNTSLTSVSCSKVYTSCSTYEIVFVFQIPELPLPSLLSLDLSKNQIEAVSSDRASNLSSLRHLDLSHNQLIEFPLVMMSLPELNSLNVANNRIYDLNNSTFTVGVHKLIFLDLSYLPLVSFEVR